MLQTPSSPDILRSVEPTLRRAPSDAIWYGVSKGVPAAIGIASVPFFIRFAGSAAYGYYSASWATGLVVANLTSGWLRQSALRFSGDDEKDLSALHRGAVATTLAVTVLVAVPTATLALHGEDPRYIFLVLSIAMAVAITCQQLIVTFLQAQRRARAVALVEGLRAALSSAFAGALLIATGAGAEALVGGMVLASLIVTAVGARTLDPGLATRASQGVTRRWWSFGWPMSLWLTIAAVLQFSDRILIQHLVGAGSAGTYSAVYDATTRILAVCIFPMTMASHALVMSHWNEADGSRARSANRRSILIQSAVFLPLLLAAIFLRGPLVRLLIGRADAGAESLVIPLVVGSFLWQLSLNAHKVLEVNDRTTVMMVNVAACTALNIVGNLVLLPQYGPAAAAWTTLGAAFLYLCLTEISALVILGDSRERWGTGERLASESQEVRERTKPKQMPTRNLAGGQPHARQPVPMRCPDPDGQDSPY